MSAWGPRPFDNDLGADVLRAALAPLYAIIMEPRPEASRAPRMHVLAYYWDRVRAAIDLLLILGAAEPVRIPAGFVDVALARLDELMADSAWMLCWSGDGSQKRQNYLADVQRQRNALEMLRVK